MWYRRLLSLTLCISLATAPVYAQSTANVGAPIACPFMNQNPTDSIAQVRASLRSLAGSSNVCNQMISQNAMTLDTLLNSILEERYPVHRINLDGTTPLTCENFEAVLSRERQLAFDSKSNQYYVIGQDFLPRYRSCELFKRPANEVDESTLAPEYQGITQSQRFDICVDKVYQENFYRKVEECEIRSQLERENRRNEAYRAQISEITQVATNLITSSQECTNSDILRNITQSIIPLVTTIGTFAFANPLAGVGMALGGSLASALVDRFFNTNGPNEYITLLENEEQATNLNCLYYQIQNDVLACGRPSPLEADAPEAPVLVCAQERQDDFLNHLYTLSQGLKRIVATTDSLGQADIADQIRALLGQDLTLPDGREVKTSDYLTEAAQALRADPTRSADVMTGRRIQNVLDSHRDWQTAVNTTPIDEATVLESNSRMLAAIRGETVQQPLDLVDSMRRFWSRSQIENSATMIGRLRAMEDPDRYFSPRPMPSNDIQTTRSVRISHDALVHLYQKRFENRLKDMNEAYLRNRLPPSDGLHHTNLDYIIPLFQSCTLNAGMFHYQRRDGTHHSVNRVAERPSQPYQDVCSMFNCPGNTLLPRFEPNAASGDSVPSQFRAYQCAMKSQYNQLLNRMVRNYRQTGQICPPPPMPPVRPETAPGLGAEAAFSPAVDGESSGGGGVFGWLGSLFSGIWNGIKSIFGFGKSKDD
jgi:hypothetical protein